MEEDDAIIDDMITFIEHAINHADGGPYVREEYKKQCITFFENLIDNALPD